MSPRIPCGVDQIVKGDRHSRQIGICGDKQRTASGQQREKCVQILRSFEATNVQRGKIGVELRKLGLQQAVFINEPPEA